MKKGADYAHYKRLYKGNNVLTETEFCITKGYTGDGYFMDINGTLITNAGEKYPGKFDTVRDDWMDSIVRQMNRALDKLPKTKKDTVYRGLDLEPDFVREKFKTGKSVRLYGYQSTSEVAPYSGNVQITIELTKKQGGLVNEISDASGENEFLMKPGLTFDVQECVEEIPGRFAVKLREI